jgi:hypothetical protein
MIEVFVSLSLFIIIIQQVLDVPVSYNIQAEIGRNIVGFQPWSEAGWILPKWPKSGRL